MANRIGKSSRERRFKRIGVSTGVFVALSVSALAVAFSVRNSPEPTVTATHAEISLARTLAESGVERAAWALNNPTAGAGLGIPPAQVPARSPFDGSRFFLVDERRGGFTVQVVAGGSQNERAVTAVGWTPNNTAPNRVQRKVQARLQLSALGVRLLDPPCALCVNGQAQIAGRAEIRSQSNGCGTNPPPSTAVMSTGGIVRTGEATHIYGYGNSRHNEGADVDGAARSATSFTYTRAELAHLKAVAQRDGTYFRGARTSIPTQARVIFIDTTTGTSYSRSTPDAEAGSLTLGGTQTYTGLIIVSGPMTLSGRNTFNGLLYALNNLTMTGNITVNGAVVSENRRDPPTNIVSPSTSSNQIHFHCGNIRSAGGTVTPTWSVVPGTSRDIAG